MFQLFTSIPKMRKFFAIMVICCWIFAVPASQVATSLQIDSTYEEVVPIPTPIPTTELVFEQDDSKMARQAIQATLDKYALTFLPADTAITVLEFRQEGEWAYAEVTWPSLEIESMYVLAHQQENGRWQAALPFVNSLYSHWVAKIPADFLNISIDNNVLLNDDLHIDFRSFIQDDKLRYAIYQTLQAKPKDLFPGKQYAVTSLFQKDTWHFISIASINESGCSLRFVGNGDCGSYMIATNDQEFGWLVGLAGTPNFVDLLSNIPTSILPSESKFILNPNNQTLLKENALDYKFPWPSGKWEYRGGWHFSAVDIGTRDSDKRILSAASGVISVICRSTDGNSANVTIVHDDGTSLGYFHLDRHSLASNITEQARVIQGQVLGNLLPGTWSDNCGYTVGQASNSAHIHWVLPTSASFNADGWTIEYSDSTWRNGIETRIPGTSPYQTLTSTNVPNDGSLCSVPSLVFPENNYSYTSLDRTITFSWSSPSNCTPDGYTFRVKTVPTMDSGGTTVFDEGSGSQISKQFDSQWDNIDLYWSVRACAPCTPFNPGEWAPARHFRIEPSAPTTDVSLCKTDQGSDCTTFSVGTYSNLSNQGLNDTIRSVRVASGKSVMLFREEDLKGTAECYSSDRIPLPLGDPWDLRGQVTGLQVFAQSGCPASQLSSIVMYNDPNFVSHYWGVGADAGVVNLSDLYSNAATYFNDNAQSMRIPNGKSVRIYEHNDRGGEASGCLTGDVASLGSLDNRVSSVEIFNNTSCTIPLPNAPSNLATTSVSDNTIVFSWQDNSNNETGFRVYRWDTQDGVNWDFFLYDTVGSNVIAYSDTSLNCGSTYWYKVSAFNGSGESAQTPYIGATTTACPQLPSSPTNLVVTNTGTNNIDLQWQDNSNNETGFEIYRRLLGSGQAFSAIDSTTTDIASYIDSSVVCDTAYEYQVTAFNLSGESSPTNAAIGLTNPCNFEPDLYPFAPTGYSWPVTPASTAGTTTPNTLYANQTTYFDWYFANGGNSITPSGFYVDFLLDNTRLIHYPFSDVSPNQVRGFDDWMIDGISAGWHTVELITDAQNMVTESDETNNSWQGDFYWTADIYEPNNVLPQATNISYGQTLHAELGPSGDEDYYRFNGLAGDKVVIDIDAQNLGSNLDSYLYLYDSNSLLDENDDEDSLDSKVFWTLAANDTYFIRVREYNHPNEGNPDYFYDVSLTIDDTPPNVEITSPSPGDYLNTNIYTITATVSDSESGVNHLKFFVWYDAEWHYIGSDNDGGDGWSIVWDATNVEDQGIAVWVYAFDNLNNYSNDNFGELILDRTPPETAVVSLPSYHDTTSFLVSWWGDDNLAGMAPNGFDIQYRDDSSGTWTDWQIGVTTTSATFTGEVGHTYYFRSRATDNAGNTGVYADGDGDTYTTVTPVNDNIEHAVSISTMPYFGMQQTKGATTAVSDPIYNCVPGQRYNTVWYKYTPTEDGILTVDTFDTTYDTVLAIWTDDSGTLNNVDCNDDSSGLLQSHLEVGVIGQTTYWIEVAGYSQEAYGVLSLSANYVPIPNCSITDPETLDVTLSGSIEHIQLSWSNNVTHSGKYEIYRTTLAEMNFGDTPYIILPYGTTTFIDETAELGNPTVNYIYLVQAENCTNTLRSNPSSLGEFDFVIYPGSNN